AAMLDGQRARGAAEASAHVEHAHAGPEPGEAGQAIRRELATAVGLIDHREGVDGQRVEVLARGPESLVEQPLEVAAAPVRVRLLRVTRRQGLTPSRSQCARRQACPEGDGAGSRAPAPPRPGAATRGRREYGCVATPPRFPWQWRGRRYRR